MLQRLVGSVRIWAFVETHSEGLLPAKSKKDVGVHKRRVSVVLAYTCHVANRFRIQDPDFKQPPCRILWVLARHHEGLGPSVSASASVAECSSGDKMKRGPST